MTRDYILETLQRKKEAYEALDIVPIRVQKELNVVKRLIQEVEQETPYGLHFQEVIYQQVKQSLEQTASHGHQRT